MPQIANWGWQTIGESVKDPKPGPLPYPKPTNSIIRKET